MQWNNEVADGRGKFGYEQVPGTLVVMRFVMRLTAVARRQPILEKMLDHLDEDDSSSCQ